MELFWHRRDLRVADNVGLAAATGTRDDGRGPAAPVFVFDPDVLDHASDVRVRRLLDGLAAALGRLSRPAATSSSPAAPPRDRPPRTGPPRSTPSASSGTGTTRGSLASATRACGRRSTTPESTARYSTTRCYTPRSRSGPTPATRTRTRCIRTTGRNGPTAWPIRRRRRPMRAISLTPAI